MAAPAHDQIMQGSTLAAAGKLRYAAAGDKLLIVGGIYGNWQAFERLLDVITREKLSVEQVIFTGDLVAYCADGAAVAAYCRSHFGGSVMVRGNCERALAEDLDDCACGFEAGSVCRVLSESWFAHARRSIDADLKAWMGALPARVDLDFGGRRVAVIHGGADADNTFIFASDDGAGAHITALGVDGVIGGHCGVPFTRRWGGRLWHNSGALGMPANDGTARVWYSVWELAGDGVDIRHCSLAYDSAAAAAAMRAAGLPAGYQRTLVSGIWPSDSVLPAAERQQQGVPLSPPPHRW